MYLSRIITFLLILGITIFALQNSVPLDITFFIWQFRTSLVAVIFAACSVGLLIGLVFTLPRLTRKHLREKKLIKVARDLEERCAVLDGELTQVRERERTMPAPGGIPTGSGTGKAG